jgi:hypothetical protein
LRRDPRKFSSLNSIFREMPVNLQGRAEQMPYQDGFEFSVFSFQPGGWLSMGFEREGPYMGERGAKAQELGQFAPEA